MARPLSWILIGTVLAVLAACNGGGSSDSGSNEQRPATPVAQNTPVQGSTPANGSSYYSFTTGASSNYAIVLSNESAQGMAPGAGLSQQSATSSLSAGQVASSAQRMTYRRNTPVQASSTQAPQFAPSTGLNWTIFFDPGFTNELGSCGGGNCLVPLNANATYYVRVENPNPQPVSFTMTVKITYQQGFFDAPQGISLSTPFAASVDGNGYSFYQFTMPYQFGNIAIGLTGSNTQIGWALFSDPGFNNLVAQCTNFANGLDQVCLAPIAAYQTYYLLVHEFSGNNGFATLGVGVGEGNHAGPVTLNVGTSHSGAVEAGGTSYYQFTIGTPGQYTIAVTSQYVDYLNADLFSDPAFSQSIVSCQQTSLYSDAPAVVHDCTAFLNAGTYYLAISNPDSSLVHSYSIIVPGSPNEGSPQAAVPLTLAAPRHSTVDAYGTSYYRFTTSAANPLQLTISTLNSTSTNLAWTLYTDAQFSQPVPSSGGHYGMCPSPGYVFVYLNPAANRSCMVSLLSPNTTYYLAVQEFGGATSTFDLLATGSEGSPSSPILVPLDQERVSIIDALGSSYYAFTAGQSGQYTIGFTGAPTGDSTGNFTQMSWTLFDDAAFSHQIALCSYATLGTNPACPVTLAEGKAYYLKAQDFSNSQSRFNVVVGSPAFNQGSFANPFPIAHWSTSTSLDLWVTDVLTTGAFGQSFYSFTVEESGRYVLKVSRGWDELGWALYGSVNSEHALTTCSPPAMVVEGTSCVVTLVSGTTYILTDKDYAGTTYNSQMIIALTPSDRPVTATNTPSSPMSLCCGQPVGMAAGGRAYYTLTTGAAPTVYYFAVKANANVSWTLYSDAGFSETLFTCDSNSTTGGNWCFTPTLAAATNYYIAVSENDGIAEPGVATYTIPFASLPLGSANEGSLNQPIPLDVGAVPRVSTAGATGSFYSFATSAAGTYRIAASDLGSKVGWYLFDDAGFSHQIAQCLTIYNSASGMGDCNVALNGNATYYLQVQNFTAIPGLDWNQGPVMVPFNLQVTIH